MATTSYSTTTLLSFSQWLDNYLLQRGQAYVNTTGRFYYQADSTLIGKVGYAAPFRSIVYDSGVSGALILETVNGSLGTLGRGQSGMTVDYPNGRVLFNSAVGASALISGAYSFRDINVYFANQSQERIVFTNKYYLNSRFNRSPTSIPAPNQFVTPAIFVSIVKEKNEPGAYGGLYNTRTSMAMNVLAETQSQLEGVMSLLTDADQISFPQLPASAYPLGSFGDCKSGYNYETVMAQYGSSDNLYTVYDIEASPMPDSVRADEGLFVGLVECDVVKMRTIH
jgi:hypothetical protein